VGTEIQVCLVSVLMLSGTTLLPILPLKTIPKSKIQRQKQYKHPQTSIPFLWKE
jgi:hypothetical protein